MELGFAMVDFVVVLVAQKKNLMRAPIVSLLYLSRWNTVWFGGLYVSYYGKLVTKQRVMGCMHVCPCY